MKTANVITFLGVLLVSISGLVNANSEHYRLMELHAETARVDIEGINNLYTSHINLIRANQNDKKHPLNIKIHSDEQIQTAMNNTNRQISNYAQCLTENSKTNWLYKMVVGELICKDFYQKAFRELTPARNSLKKLLGFFLESYELQPVPEKTDLMARIYDQGLIRLTTRDDAPVRLSMEPSTSSYINGSIILNHLSNKPQLTTFVELEFESDDNTASFIHYAVVLEDNNVIVYSPDLKQPYKIDFHDFTNIFIMKLHKQWQGEEVKALHIDSIK